MLHIRFYTFSIEYILCIYPSPKPKKKSMIKLELEKNSFIFFFITCAHYLHSVLSHLLVFSLSFSLFCMLYSTHTYICFHRYIHISHALIVWSSCLSLWSVGYTWFSVFFASDLRIAEICQITFLEGMSYG